MGRVRRRRWVPDPVQYDLRRLLHEAERAIRLAWREVQPTGCECWAEQPWCDCPDMLAQLVEPLQQHQARLAFERLSPLHATWGPEDGDDIPF